MRAIRQDTLGSPEVLKEVEVERPEPGLSQVLVRVHAAGDTGHVAGKLVLTMR